MKGRREATVQVKISYNFLAFARFPLSPSSAFLLIALMSLLVCLKISFFTEQESIFFSRQHCFKKYGRTFQIQNSKGIRSKLQVNTSLSPLYFIVLHRSSFVENFHNLIFHNFVFVFLFTNPPILKLTS